jgi:hypothetical protein
MKNAAHRLPLQSGAAVPGQFFIGGLLIFDKAVVIKEYECFRES